MTINKESMTKRMVAGGSSFLALYLPHKVNMERSSANWNAASSTLTITMPIVGRDICNQLK